MILAQHPTAGELARYAVADEERDESVRAHLEGGCGICVLAVRRLREIAAMGDEDPASDDRGWIVPRRISFHQGGARGAARADVQLVCGAGPYELDVLVREVGAPRPQLEIVGQVMRAGSIFEPVPDLALSLVDAGTARPLSTTETDEFGEFDLRSGLEGSYGLRLGPGDGAPCVLVWGGRA